jgi:hypothetical protein
VEPSAAGFTRRRRGKGFGYLDVRGRTIDDPQTLRRIRSLAIPPAWTDVWIVPTRGAIFRRWGPMPPDGASTCTTLAGASGATG